MKNVPILVDIPTAKHASGPFPSSGNANMVLDPWDFVHFVQIYPLRWIHIEKPPYEIASDPFQVHGARVRSSNDLLAIG